MLPVRLEIKNFLSYRAPDPIYFEGIHLACLTGPNGAGKSSLLDAMTWVLWGKSRTRRDDDMVHVGQVDMYVQLDFEQEGVMYRVVRRRRSGKRGQSSLDFFVIQPDGELRTLNDPSIRETQARIQEILHLDYNTFVRSAFLKQGQADAFTVSSPAERKETLSTILGLEGWKVYEERAKERLKQIESELQLLNLRLSDIEEELAKAPQYQRDQETAQITFDGASQDLTSAEEQLAEVAHADHDLSNRQNDLASVRHRLKQHRSEINGAQQDIESSQKKIADYESILEQAESIEQGYQELQRARDLDSSLGKKQSQLSDLDNQYNALVHQLQEQTSRLEREQHGYERTIAELKRTLEASPDEDLAQVTVEIETLETLEQERESLNNAINSLNEERSGLSVKKSALHSDGDALKDRIARLQEAQDATCPLCGQTLTDDHRDDLIAQLTTELEDKRAAYRESNVRLQAIQEEETTAREKLQDMSDELARLPALRSRAGALQKQHDDARNARTRLIEVEAQHRAITQALEADDFAPDLRQQMHDIEAERERIGYDRETHDSAREGLEKYRVYESEHTRLQIARTGLPGEKAALETAQARLERFQKASADEEAHITDLEARIEELRLLVEEKNRREQAVMEARTRLASAREKLTIAQQRVQSLVVQRERKATLETQREDTQHQQSVYQDLRYAFSKNGVPAMIIDTAIPELEASANDLLARMTDGRMHIRLSTQREKVSGGQMETLDIDIADELGTRPYEMYSGGEAFRINFALRVSLSKMLARRAGAHLRTLFIDEGFGTQDEIGRARLLEAITAIEDEFDLILVITHIDELRDSFPVHVVVEKTPQGSRVQIK